MAMAAGGVGAVTVAVAFDEIEALVYVAALLAILISMNRLFRDDYEDGSLEHGNVEAYTAWLSAVLVTVLPLWSP